MTQPITSTLRRCRSIGMFLRIRAISENSSTRLQITNPNAVPNSLGTETRSSRTPARRNADPKCSRCYSNHDKITDERCSLKLVPLIACGRAIRTGHLFSPVRTLTRSLCRPKYRQYNASGQANVTLAGRHHDLDPHGRPASKQVDDRLIVL